MSSASKRPKRKRFLVTGGSRGLGLAICERLLSEGHEVLTASRRGSEQLSELMETFPQRLRHCPADFAQPGAAVQSLVESVRALEGLDGFVANAAIGTEGLLALTSDAAIEECVRINLTSTISLTREVIKGMLSRGGSLVFVSSVAARTGYRGLSVYAATKGALLAFSRTLAKEYGARGIRSNCVLPGFLETDMNAGLSPASRRRALRRTALNRFGRTNEVAELTSFLLSNAAAYITGSEFVIDGGSTA